MDEENKLVKFEMDGSNMKIVVDPNKDGEPVLELKIALAEVPDEILSAFKKED